MNSINSPCHCWYVKPRTRCQCRQNMKPINYWNVQFDIFFRGKRKNQQMLAKVGISRMRESGKKSPCFNLLLSALHLNVASASCPTPFYVMMVLATRDTLFIFFFCLCFISWNFFDVQKLNLGPCIVGMSFAWKMLEKRLCMTVLFA